MKKNKTLIYYLNLPYKIILHYEPDDKTWIATHPELGAGTCYAIGNTQEEALKQLKEEKKFILEYALTEGKDIPKPGFEDDDLPSGNFVLRIPKTLHKKLKELADKENISLNQFITSILSVHAGESKVTSMISELLDRLTASDISSNIKYLHPKKSLKNENIVSEKKNTYIKPSKHKRI